MNIEQRTREHLQRNIGAESITVPDGLAAAVKAGQRRRDIRLTVTALAAAAAVVTGGAIGLSYGLGQNTSTRVDVLDQPTSLPTMSTPTTTGVVAPTASLTVVPTGAGASRGVEATMTVRGSQAPATVVKETNVVSAAEVLAVESAGGDQGGAVSLDVSSYRSVQIATPGSDADTGGCSMRADGVECTVNGRELTDAERQRWCDWDAPSHSVKVGEVSQWACRQDITVGWHAGSITRSPSEAAKSLGTQWYFDLKPKGFDPNTRRPMLLPGMTLKHGKFTLANKGGAIVATNTATGASFTIRGKDVDFTKMRPENPPGFKLEP